MQYSTRCHLYVFILDVLRLTFETSQVIQTIYYDGQAGETWSHLSDFDIFKVSSAYSPEWRLEIASFYKLISYDINLQI